MVKFVLFKSCRFKIKAGVRHQNSRGMGEYYLGVVGSRTENSLPFPNSLATSICPP